MTVTARRSHPFEIEVVRSKRRRRSVSAELVGTTLKVSIPAWMTQREEERSVDEMVRRFTRYVATTEIDLADRARTLAARYGLPLPDHIEWASNLKAVWGLCTPEDRSVRISERLVGFPSWVLDYVIIHELAHLSVSGHNRDFWALVRKFPKTERAIGYLMAKSGTDDVEPSDNERSDVETRDNEPRDNEPRDIEPGDLDMPEGSPDDARRETPVSEVPSGTSGNQLSLDLTSDSRTGDMSSGHRVP